MAQVADGQKLLGLMVAATLWLPASGVLLPDRVSAQSAPTPATHAASRIAEANRLLEQGNQQYQVSQFREALESLEQAVELYQNSDVRTGFTLESIWGEGNALRGLGNIYFSLGEYETALGFYQQALEVFSQTADSQDELLRQGEGNALNNLGNAHYKLGQYEQAYDFYEQALEIARRTSDQRGEGRALNNLALAASSRTYDVEFFQGGFLGICCTLDSLFSPLEVVDRECSDFCVSRFEFKV